MRVSAMLRAFLAGVLGCGLVLSQTAGVSALEAEAQRLLAARDAAGALVKYRELAKLNPNSAVYQDHIGFILAATNRAPEAIPHFEQAVKLDPNYAAGFYHLGVALWLEKQIDPAVRAMQKAAALAPGQGDYRLRLGVAYNETGHYEDALVELTAAIKSLPKSALAWQNLALANQRLGKFA